jgi:membrane-associated phospholipid phosphatase
MSTLRKSLVALIAIALAAGVATVAVGQRARAGNRTASDMASARGSGKLIVDWNQELIRTIGAPGLQPLTVHPTRSFAILQAAEYDAVVSTTGKGRPYLFSAAAPRDARPDSAADQAAHDVLAALYPSRKVEFDRMLVHELASIPEGPATRAGTAVGHIVALRLLAARSSDGSETSPPGFVAGTQPGQYRPTPPGFKPPVFTAWTTVKPFVLDRASQFRPASPPPLGSAAYASALNEVTRYGAKSSVNRTSDQTLLARFWGAAPIWNVWNEVAQKEALAKRLSLTATSRLFSQLDLALADTSIALYDAKYHYRLWRPVTAIRFGDAAASPPLVANPTWSPLAITAPDPSYPGAHSAFSEAAATVLAGSFGDRQTILVTSDGMPGVTRTFSSFVAAANEAGLSRIFAGQHFHFDHEAGQTLGRQVAQLVLERS